MTKSLVKNAMINNRLGKRDINFWIECKHLWWNMITEFVKSNTIRRMSISTNLKNKGNKRVKKSIRTKIFIIISFKCTMSYMEYPKQ